MVSTILPSCTEETVIERSGSARITPHVTIDPTVTAPDGTEVDISSLIPDESEVSFTLEADDGRYSHTWPTITQYPVRELLRPGAYTAYAWYGNLNTEGFDHPFILGSSRLHLVSGGESEVAIKARVASALLLVRIAPDLATEYADITLTAHSYGYGYLTFDKNEHRPGFIHPGSTDLIIGVTDSNGNNARISIATIENTIGGNVYIIDLTSDGKSEPTVKALINGKEAGMIQLTNALMTAPAPTINITGLQQPQPLEIFEGDIPSAPIGFDISNAEAKNMVLSTVSTSLIQKGWPQQIDLANAGGSDLSRMQALGLRLETTPSGSISKIDLSKALSQIRIDDQSTDSKFYLTATGTSGKQSAPTCLSVNVKPVGISLESISDMLIGVDAGEIIIESDTAPVESNMEILMQSADGSWAACPINEIRPRGNSKYAVVFHAAGTSSLSSVPVRVMYCQRLIGESSVKRVSPEYSVEVDAYAMSASIRVSAADPALTELITDMLHVYVDGAETLVVHTRADETIAYISNLRPNTNYVITTSLVTEPTAADLSAPVEIHTEQTTQLKNNTFWNHDDGIKYKSLPSGGRYSQSIVDIFNSQNYTDIFFQQPRSWANTNAKTFCMDAARHNTWYMQPSVISDIDNVAETFAVILRSVGWDIDGEPIADYRQIVNEFIPYNPNIPKIKYRAAGKVFLGNYKFDPKTRTETYIEGISFGSRPVAVNGYYHFTPCALDLNDCGKVMVEVIGEWRGGEIAIARNTLLLPAALTFTSFTIPLTYSHFGVKATKLKIMISSSQHTGSIEYESAHIVTAPDPKTASSIGGTLWIQDISLSYN